MARETLRWLAIAEQDLKAAVNNVYGPEPTPEIAAYHCQQAAEKIVEAALIGLGVDPPRWHNIDALIALIPDDHFLRTELAALRRLTPYAVAYRYPVPDPEALPERPEPSTIVEWLGELRRCKDRVAAMFHRPPTEQEP